MANFGVDCNVNRRCLFWSLVAQNWIRHSRLSLDSRVRLVCAAVRGVVHSSREGSVRCHGSPEIKRAATAPLVDMPAWCCGVRSRSVFVADVARAVASGSSFCSLRLACFGSRDNQANSSPPKGAAVAISREMFAVIRIVGQVGTSTRIQLCSIET